MLFPPTSTCCKSWGRLQGSTAKKCELRHTLRVSHENLAKGNESCPPTNKHCNKTTLQLARHGVQTRQDQKVGSAGPTPPTDPDCCSCFSNIGFTTVQLPCPTGRCIIPWHLSHAIPTVRTQHGATYTAWDLHCAAKRCKQHSRDGLHPSTTLHTSLYLPCLGEGG